MITIFVIACQDIFNWHLKTHDIHNIMKTKYSGKKLAQIRRGKGFSQRDLADKIGVSVRVISYYENESSYPPAQLLPKIAKALNVSLDEIFGLANLKNLITPKNMKLWKKLQKAEDLTKSDQEMVVKLINSLSKKNHS